MLNRFDKATIAVYATVLSVYCTVKHDVKECFTSDERGVSGIVVSVLLIMVAVLAAIALWGVLGPFIQEQFEKITNKSNGDLGFG